MDIDVTAPAGNILEKAALEFDNWGRWGKDDELGTLNFITPEKIAAAAALVTEGKTISLAIPLGASGPQTGHLGRFNPTHFMLRDGDDAYARAMPGVPRGIGGSDDAIMLATHSATHWDALSHMFLDGQMWNGLDCRLVSSFGAEANDIVKYRDKIVGRGVLLDIPRFLGLEWCDAGYAITEETLVGCAALQGVEIRSGDIILLRTGQMQMCRQRGSWGDYAGGDAPGVDFDTLSWVYHSEIAGIASDTWGVEVRPNIVPWVNQPWHRIAIPKIGLLVGEMFDLDELASDCASDGRYEMLLVASPLPIEGGVGGPSNPIAMK